MMQIGITAPIKNIDKNIIDRFKYYLDKSTNLQYRLELIDDLKDNNIFNRSKYLNYGVNKLKNCDIIVTTDIDMIFPPGLLNYLENYFLNNLYPTNINIRCRNIKIENFLNEYKQIKWDDFLKLPIYGTSKGSLNSCTYDTYLLTGGHNEDMIGWGYEDNDFHNRIKSNNIKLIIDDNFSLLHVEHEPRSNNQKQSAINNKKRKNNINYMKQYE